MKRHIVCFGDSNTFGYCADPNDCADRGGRFNEDERWPQLLQKNLGHDYLIIEEGLCGRTTVFDDPFSDTRSGLDYIIPCVSSHGPVDLLIIMLGTNDVKERFASSPACIGMGMGRLISAIMPHCNWGPKGVNVLVIAPPHIHEEIYQTSHANTMGPGCVEKSRELAHFYKLYCQRPGVSHLDAQALGCEFNQIDHMHLTKKGHATLAAHLTDLIPQLLK